MITGAVELDMSRDSQSADRHAIGSLYALSDGCRVILRVGARDFVPPDVVALLEEYVTTLHFEIHGNARAVEAWVRALRSPSSNGWGFPT